MPETTLPTPVELTDAELDQVSAGQVQTGLVNVAIKHLIRDVRLLNHDEHLINVLNQDHILNNNQLSVNLAAAITALGSTIQSLKSVA